MSVYYIKKINVLKTSQGELFMKNLAVQYLLIIQLIVFINDIC